MANPSKPTRDWPVVAREVSREPDQDKMMALVEELLQALEQARPGTLDAGSAQSASGPKKIA